MAFPWRPMLYVLAFVQTFILLVWFIIPRPPDAAMWPIFTPPLFVPVGFALHWLYDVVLFGLVKLLNRQRD